MTIVRDPPPPNPHIETRFNRTVTLVVARILAAGATALLGLCCVGCGGTSTGARFQIQARSAQTPVAGREDQSISGFDPDKDRDGAHPDPDDSAPPPKLDRDGDSDNSAGSYFDSDDRTVLGYGTRAHGSEAAAITALVTRYLAAAASDDGAAACAMVYSTYAEAIPEDIGTSPPGPVYARGTTCALVATHVFAHNHVELARKSHELRIVRIGVHERSGIVVLGFHRAAPSELTVKREGKVWKVLGLVDGKLQ